MAIFVNYRHNRSVIRALIAALNKLPGMHAKEVHAQYSGV